MVAQLVLVQSVGVRIPVGLPHFSNVAISAYKQKDAAQLAASFCFKWARVGLLEANVECVE